MEARIDPDNNWLLITDTKMINPDNEVVNFVNIISFKTEAEAKGFVKSLTNCLEKATEDHMSYMIINRNNMERIK